MDLHERLKPQSYHYHDWNVNHRAEEYRSIDWKWRANISNVNTRSTTFFHFYKSPRKRHRSPCSSYWARVTTKLLNVANDARMLPPVKACVNRSGGAEMRRRACAGARALDSANNRSPKPAVRVVPPLTTTCCHNLGRNSRSDLAIALHSTSAAPGSSEPIKVGSNRILGAWKRSRPRVTTCPSGSWYCVVAVAAESSVGVGVR